MLLWVNKTAKSASLSHSEELERIQLLSHAQRISRCGKRKLNRKLQRLEKEHSCKDPASYHLTYTIAPSLDLTPTWTSAERRGVTFFLETTVQEIITLHQDSTFWKDIVPRLATQHAAFTHLLVAIASTHEYLIRTNAMSLDTLALTQCNKATKLLRGSTDWTPPLLLASCILTAAYSLLRCDFPQAEMSIESGLKLKLDDLVNQSIDGCICQSILSRLGRTHGFKLWAPRITFQFEKTDAGRGCLDIHTDQVRGPFTELKQVYRAYRDLMLEVVAPIMRNLARGAYLDPASPLAQDTIQQLAMFSFYWKCFYDQLPVDREERRLELMQLRIAFNNAYLVVFTKIIRPRETTFETYPTICDLSLDCADEALAAIRSGFHIPNTDRIVYGSLFSLGLCSRSSQHRKRVVHLLQSQVGSQEDGVVHFLRGTVIQIVQQIEEVILASSSRARIILSDLSYRADKCVRVDYTLCTGDDETLGFAELPVELDELNRISHGAVHDILQGIMAAYRTYGKPRPSEAPLGYVREMRHRGRRVPVLWESEWLDQDCASTPEYL